MHACVVMQHYLVAMNNEEVVPMLDMAEYLKKYMSGDSLYLHIWNAQGRDPLEFFEKILKKRPSPYSMISPSSNLLSNADLDALLRSYGPGLVSGFCVAKTFISEEWQHLGNYDDKEFEGRHAMVLVGSRVVEGKKRYLLQNWWKSKPYIEVDADYLIRSKATVHFIKEPQMQMGDYPANLEALVECNIDASENFVPERFNDMH